MVNLMAGRRLASNLEHRRIVEAIKAGSAQEAREAMQAHLGEVEQVVSTLIGEDQAHRS
jgi:DNA-binding FadR family transcriptional regulator